MTQPQVNVAALTHVGRVRKHNEDAYLADGTVFAVADGMGGHEAGEVASAAVIEELSTLRGSSHDGATTPRELVDAIERAQTHVAAISGGLPRGAGSTVAGVALVDFPQGAHWLVFNIGDSRVYRLLAGEFRQLSIDHSLVQEMVDEGTLTREQARTSPQRNVITRALGSADWEPAYLLIPVTDTERILVCSDGLTNEVDDDQLAEFLASDAELDSMVHELCELALANGGRDNISIVVVDVVLGGAPPAATVDSLNFHPTVDDIPDEDTAPTGRFR